MPLADRVQFARDRASRAVHLDPCRRAAAWRGRCAGRHASIRCRKRRRTPKPRGSPRRRTAPTSIAGVDLTDRTRRRGGHPDRSRAARDQDIFGAVRAQARRLHADADAAAQESAQVGRLPGAQGARRALGADRARLRVQPAGHEVADLARLARAHRRRHRRRRSTRYFTTQSPPAGASRASAKRPRTEAHGAWLEVASVST